MKDLPDAPDENWGFYHKLRPARIQEIRSRAPVAYLPWGALEWHSYHNPIGLDGMIADGLCTALAKEAGGLVLPPVYAGTDTIKVEHGFTDSIEHRQSTIESLCVEFCRQLADEQFELIVIVTGHCGGGHREALSSAVKKAAGYADAAKIILIPAFDSISDVWPANHAALGETSLQMHISRDLVNLSKLPGTRPPDLDRDGVWGDDPRAASQEKGAEIVKLFVERCAPEIKDFLIELLKNET